MKLKTTTTKLLLIVSLFFTLFYNFTFFKKVLAVYSFSGMNIVFVASLFIFLWAAIHLFLTLLRAKFYEKPFLIVLFFLSTMAAYMMDSFGIAIDDVMLLNVVKTDAKESLDLMTWRLGIYLLLLFVLPSLVVFFTQIEYKDTKTQLLSRFKGVALSLLAIILVVAPMGKFYASFFRTQKPIRYYTNPTYYLYSMGKFSTSFVKNPQKELEALGRDSIIPEGDPDRELIILVVGETARRDHFSLNGYEKETNPLLKKENVVSFTNVTSCGTSTAVSVPCMFSHFGRRDFSVDKGIGTENLLDVLSHTKAVNILWRDNNSDSKGVAKRIKYEDYKSSSTNTICDPECRDVGMLVGLQEYIDKVKEQDVLIILHQMGNHGPAYYKRYPKEFEVFTPVCKTNELSKCTNEEISNAYDNAILYTDFFLSKVIELLKANSHNFNTGMLYISDHGESLGENGVYLHSMPYMIAPKAQIEVPMIMWFGGHMARETNYVGLRRLTNEPYSHDNIFHTILGMMEVRSSAYVPELDILHGIHIQPEIQKK